MEPESMSDKVQFFPMTNEESIAVIKKRINPNHIGFLCGACGESTNGRVIACMTRSLDGADVFWCHCSCQREEPTLIVAKGTSTVSQLPLAQAFHASTSWPGDLQRLFDEAAKAFAAGAYTASAMAARKVLMACACEKGAKEGENFLDYVTHITDKVLLYPPAKASIDRIRTIGNEANHKVAFVSRDDAQRALEIVRYMLNTIYALPGA
jgi:hypothetical protein